MLVVLVAAIAAYAPCPPQGSQADPPVGVTVVIAGVGQGDGMIVRAPNGTVHVIDAGPNGEGTATMLPAIAALQPAGYGYTFLSHFHDDHQGGLDEVLALPFQFAFDRGDVNRPSNSGVNSYLAAAGPRRAQIALGSIYQLGGGATLRCIALNGFVLGGAFVDPTMSAQEENSRSIVLRLDYGDFSMWFGGDLTGGASSTADVESPASLACGDVDVYKLNHHGSNTSTNLNLVANLSPELAVVSCGAGNSYGHPTPTIVNRLNQAAAARALLSTTTGSANTTGFSVAGAIRIDSDGRRYRATAQNGDFVDFFCDELVTPPLAAGDVRISEVHRDPTAVADTNGEYVEVVNLGARPLGLRGLRISDNASTTTLASNLMLVPGRALLLQIDGAGSRNGGQPLGLAMPAATMALSNSSDNVTLQHGTTAIDTLVYTSSLPGGAGIASERRNLFAPHSTGSVWNYAPAPLVFGAGDRGSPGQRNATDLTVHPVQVAATVVPGRVTLHGTALGLPNHFSVLLLANADAPGTPFGSVVIPLAFDALFQASLGAPGFVGLVPPLGYRSVDVLLPQPNPLTGVQLFAAHVLLDLNLAVPGLSGSVSFQLP